MMTACRLSALAIELLWMVLVPANARPVRLWSPAELTQKADLIVIAAIQSTGDLKPMDLSTAKFDTWVPVKSVFVVQSVLKGHLAGKTVTVDHYRYMDKRAEISVVDGPSFVEFNPAKKSQYLIYLKHRSSDTYEPLTGQEDPGLSFALLEPINTGPFTAPQAGEAPIALRAEESR